MCRQGLIDVTKELQKLQEKVTRIEKENARLTETASRPDYMSKVPEHVRQEKADKVS